MNEKPRDDLHYFQWEVSDAQALKQLVEMGAITLANIGELFLSVMAYVNKEDIEVSPELKILFTTYKTRVDGKREARVKIGISRAENGQKGGLTKAANATKNSNGTKFRPPTQRQFRDAVKHFADNGEIDEDTTDYDADSFFDELAGAKWSVNGKPIQCRSDWESVIRAKFFAFHGASIRHLYYSAFSVIFADFCPDEKENGGEWADSATYDFFDAYDEDSRCWAVQGESFPATKWKDALTQFMKQYDESQ